MDAVTYVSIETAIVTQNIKNQSVFTQIFFFKSLASGANEIEIKLPPLHFHTTPRPSNNLSMNNNELAHVEK